MLCNKQKHQYFFPCSDALFHNEPKFGPKRDEVTGEWRKLHNELNDLYSSPVIWVIKKEE
jgi:hypothetical protein